MAASKAVRRKSLVSRTLERCRSGLSPGRPAAAGCFPVYVGPERERFVVRAECANHPLFRRLLDDAEREYGYAAQGALALPCGVDAFLDVMWQIDHEQHDDDDDDDNGEVSMAAAASTPICGLQGCSPGRSKGRAAGYRVLSSAKTSPASFFSRPSPTAGRRSCIGEHAERN